MSDTLTQSEKLNEVSTHPIAAAIDRALHRCRDIDAVVRLVVPFTGTLQNGMFKVARRTLEQAEERLNSSRTISGKSSEMVIADLDDAFMYLDRLTQADLPATLLTSLFLGLFSAYDAFTGNLLQSISKKRPQILESFNVQISLSDILKYNSIEEVKEAVLLDEIESFRRKSYTEQFEQLEARFGIQLRRFPHWSDFIEMSQRRNLVTHCDSIISKQYIKICTGNGYKLPSESKEGALVKIDMSYLTYACSVVYEVVFKLGQTLWRKLLPEEFDQANKHLTSTTYEALRMERWSRAILLSEFAAAQPQPIKDLERRMQVINHAIAAKFSDDNDTCNKLLNSEDWSASLPEFSMARATLTDDYEEAARIMKTIGKKGQLVTQISYHTWPLFRKFRRSEQFLATYNDVYGKSFAEEAVETASKAPEEQMQSSNSDENISDAMFEPQFSLIRHIIG